MEGLNNTNRLIVLTEQQLINTIKEMYHSEDQINELAREIMIKTVVVVSNAFENQTMLSSDDLVSNSHEEQLSYDDNFGFFIPTRKEIKKNIPSIQLIRFIEYVYLDKKPNYEQQMVWLAIALYLHFTLIFYKKPKEAVKIANRFRVAISFHTRNFRWIWRRFLPNHDFSHDFEFTPDFLISFFANEIQKLELEKQEVIDNERFGVIENEEDTKFRKRKTNQLTQIHKALINAFYPYKKKKRKTKQRKRKAKTKAKTNKTKLNNRPPSLNQKQSKSKIDQQQQKIDYLLNKSDDKEDAEYHHPELDIQYPAYVPDTSYDSPLPKNYEEYVDTLEKPCISSPYFVSQTNRHSVPLQRIEQSIQHSYISQRDFEFNSNTRLLSLAGYQILFNKLVNDSDINENLKEAFLRKKCASVLLLSMLTATSVTDLLSSDFIKQSGLFVIGRTKSYRQHKIGITERPIEFDFYVHENEKDLIKIPQWLKLLTFVSYWKNLPSEDELKRYLKTIKEKLFIPNLSIGRIESALHTILHRYTPKSNVHIADLICRIEPTMAPAVYYSSHSNNELVKHYREAIKVLDAQGIFDSSYIKNYDDFTTGSAFAVRLDYVQNFVELLNNWMVQSPTSQQQFNHYSAYCWIIFCLLTGVRPNNGLTDITDIDLEVGWFLVCDKPSKVVKNHRLIPLCDTLISLLQSYKKFLSYYRDSQCSKTIELQAFKILHEQDLALLNVLSDSYQKLMAIKRGKVASLLAELMPFEDPYWTRHFVRTQFEKQNIPMVLINTVIGHEKNRHEALGRYSSVSKQQIRKVKEAFEEIARQLNIIQLDKVEAI